MLLSKLLNFSGSFIDLWILRMTALPSNAKTATPKNDVMLRGLNAFRSFRLSASFEMFERL